MGCMFSGKSTELLKRIRHHKLLGRNVLSISHSADTRYSNNEIVTHDDSRTDSLRASFLKEIDIHESVNVICIEEAQFFPDLYDTVREWALNLTFDKVIIVCGLDGDYQANPFMDLLKLIPLADNVVKLSALCMDCKDGTPANFSKRLESKNNESNNRLLIGGASMYKSVCRKHFF